MTGPRERRRFPRSFRHLAYREPSGLAAFLRWQLTSKVAPWWRRGGDGAGAPWVPGDAAALRAGDSITWAGHGSFVLRLAGRTVLVDPLWGSSGPGLTRRLAPPRPRWQDLPPVDAVLLTHNHYDHMDRATLRRLPPATPVLAPAGEGRRLRRWGFRDVREFLWWEADAVGPLSATFVPAQHWSRRGALDAFRSLWGGWVVEAGGKTVYLAGDSGWFPGFKEIGERFPGVDVAVLPIGCYAPRWFMAPQHMCPEEAGRAFLDVGAEAFVPCHWGTLRLSDEPVDEPPRRLRQWWAAGGLDPERLWLPAVGETLPL